MSKRNREAVAGLEFLFDAHFADGPLAGDRQLRELPPVARYFPGDGSSVFYRLDSSVAMPTYRMFTVPEEG